MPEDWIQWKTYIHLVQRGFTRATAQRMCVQFISLSSLLEVSSVAIVELLLSCTSWGASTCLVHMSRTSRRRRKGMANISVFATTTKRDIAGAMGCCVENIIPYVHSKIASSLVIVWNCLHTSIYYYCLTYLLSRKFLENPFINRSTSWNQILNRFYTRWSWAAARRRCCNIPQRTSWRCSIIKYYKLDPCGLMAARVT